MARWTLVASGIVLAAGGLIAARHDEKHDAVRTLAERDIAEKVDGKKAKATTVEVTLGPGEASAPHPHPGMNDWFADGAQAEYSLARVGNPLA